MSFLEKFASVDGLALNISILIMIRMYEDVTYNFLTLFFPY